MDINSVMNWLNWLFGVIGVFGVVLSIHYEQKSKKLERLKKTLTWTELQAGTNDVCKDLKRKYQFDLILTPNLRGGIIAELVADHFDRHIPIFVGQIFWKELAGEIPTIPQHFMCVTGKWVIYIPESIVAFKDRKLLIVDDFAMSGDTVLGIKEKLAARGFDLNNIKTFSLITTPIAVKSNKAPEFYWKKSADDDSFYFPWGKAR
ncbi:hypothetical protein SD71_03720 [Cohnella kolymensis]|uniref:Phosphoribosyltransferase domain-containing protein n=1 Tax=Cohnella kolymensis TaxID=1590652 RepID=A0ABR5A7Z2_9BACL|nr:phosphoribosyltransferase [Cohnella kolymensis]KIL37085.1 hypothetical protein SD71_03720 [Cohnella kolymensis]